MKTNIIIQSQFEGFHQWPEAPEEVAFLRALHRHIFCVRVGITVTESRQHEFFMVKRDLDEVLQLFKSPRQQSCEQMAEMIGVNMMALPKGYVVAFVSVFEDGENGAEVLF